MDVFWNTWRTEYLANLPAVVSKFRSRGGLQVGSVVLIREDNVPRMKWDMGVVVEVYPGKDKVVRSAKMHTASGDRVRAIQRLHNLEMVKFDPALPQIPLQDLELPEFNQDVPSKSPPVSNPEPLPNLTPTSRTRSGRLSKAAPKLDL